MKRFLILVFLLMTAPVLADPSQVDLERLQQQIIEEQKAHQELLKKAKDVQKEVSGVQKQMVRTAQDVQNFEETISDLEKSLQEARVNEARVQERLNLREGQLVQVMSALQKMAVNPPETVFLNPNGPVDTLRSSLLLKEARKPLQANADRLRQDLNMLTTLQAAIRAQAAQIKNATLRLENEKSNMERLLKQKSILQTHFETEGMAAKRKAAELGQQAKDLQDLLAKLEKERQAQRARAAAYTDNAQKQKPILSIPMPSPVAGAFAKSMGALPAPARGKIIQTYGDRLDSGMTAKGLTMQTRTNAQVIAPFDGTVLFSGPFKNYGNLIIIEHGDGYHTLLSGIDRIDAVVGQGVLTGEPVGIMSTSANQKLYIELRKDGQPINPAPWFVFTRK